jgi:cephalosporin hydroxylase
MRLIIDTDARTLEVERGGRRESLPLYGREAFELLSDEWVRVGWNEKYPYTFAWFGRPVIQLPEDMIRIQEVIYRVQPDVIIETGVAHGGSLVYYATICKAMEKGRIIGIDIEIRPHNRKAIEAHPLKPWITLIEGSSIDESTIAEVESHVRDGETVLVILDSNHTKEHVAAELELYAPLVTKDSYIVATDGVMELVHDVPRAGEDWKRDNPSEAAREFAARHPEFVLEQPAWPFNESELGKNVTHWPDAWLRRIS